MLKIGEINNCERCSASYSQYDNNPNSNWKEMWCIIPEFDENLKLKKPKGLCQFCNPKTRYFNK